MSDVSSNTKAQKLFKEHKKQQETIHDRDLATIMAMPEGRRYVFRLIDEVCGVFKPSYTGSSETYLREGKRAVGIAVMLEVQTKCTAQYVEMIKEAFNLKERDKLVAEGARQVAADDQED